MPMLEQAQEVLQSGHWVGLADTGYHSGEQIQRAEEKGFEVYVPEPKTTMAAAKDGRYTRNRFQYDAAQDRYTCPPRRDAGGLRPAPGKERQARSGLSIESRRLPAQCLAENATHKKLERWQHEAAVKRHRRRKAQASGRMQQRGQLAKHPLRTPKHRAGLHHFLLRGLEQCRGEFSHMELCNNFTRVLNLLGILALRDYCARRQGKPANRTNRLENKSQDGLF